MKFQSFKLIKYNLSQLRYLELMSASHFFIRLVADFLTGVLGSIFILEFSNFSKINPSEETKFQVKIIVKNYYI